MTYLTVAAASGEQVVIAQRNEVLIDTIEEYVESEKLVLTECSLLQHTTVELIMKKAERSMAEGWNVTRLQDELIKCGAFTPSRALMLSRTIVGTASSMGQTIAAETSGATHKRWINKPSPDTRPEHIARHQETKKKPIRMNERYSKKFGQKFGPMFPLDNILKPIDRVNCRCSQKFMILDEVGPGPGPKPRPKIQTPLPKKKKKFEKQTTIKAAEKWARENDLADKIDYSGLSLDAANTLNQALFEANNQFPGLRENQKFTGSTQAKNKLIYDARLKYKIKLYQKQGLSEKSAIRKAKRSLKLEKVPDGVYAESLSWSEKSSGVTLNEDWWNDKNYEKLKLTREDDEKMRWAAKGTGDPKGTIDHEVGHQIHHLQDDATKEKIEKYYNDIDTTTLRDDLSEYSTTNSNEMFAEAYSEYKNNPELRKTAKEIMNILGVK